MSNPTTKLSGDFASFTITSGSVVTVISCKGWTAEPEAKSLDTTSTTSNGYRQVQPGTQACNITLDGEYDSSQQLTAAPVGLAVGSFVADVACLLTQSSSSPSVTCPLALVTKVTIKSVVNEIITFTVDLESSGAFTVTV